MMINNLGALEGIKGTQGQVPGAGKKSVIEEKQTQGDKVDINKALPPNVDSVKNEVRNALDKFDEVQSTFSRCGRSLSDVKPELDAAEEKVNRLLRYGDDYHHYEAGEGYFSPSHDNYPYPPQGYPHHDPHDHFPPSPSPFPHYPNDDDEHFSRETLQLTAGAVNAAQDNLDSASRSVNNGSGYAQDARDTINKVVGHVEANRVDAAVEDTVEGERNSKKAETERTGAEDRMEKLRTNIRSARNNLNLYLDRLSSWHSGGQESLARDAVRAMDNALSYNNSAFENIEDLERKIENAKDAISDVKNELQK